MGVCMGVGAGVGVNRQTDFQRHLGFKDNPAVVALRKRVLEYSPGGGAYPKNQDRCYCYGVLLLRSTSGSM